LGDSGKKVLEDATCFVLERLKTQGNIQYRMSSSRSEWMRKAFSSQGRLDVRGVLGVALNLECRDEIIPILRALQQIYSRPELRDQILDLIVEDVNQDARDDVGREGMDYWQILVLAAVRLGCNLNYDKLQDLAEQHRALRHIMGLGDWNEEHDFGWRRIRDNLCLLKPATIEKISHLIVAEGHRLQPEAATQARADTFVMETNIHWPTESTLIRDGIRQILKLCVLLANALQLPGWRQAEHLLRQVKRHSRRIERIASRKGPNYQARLKQEYRRLLKKSGVITARARQFGEQVARARKLLATQSTSSCRALQLLRQTPTCGFLELPRNARSLREESGADQREQRRAGNERGQRRITLVLGDAGQRQADTFGSAAGG
jgi:hypothetical protein